MAGRSGGAAGGPARMDSRLAVKPPRAAPAAHPKDRNVELIAFCFGQWRCQCPGSRCSCGSSLKFDSMDAQHAVQYIPTSGQGKQHKFCLHLLIARHFDPKLIPTGAKNFWSSVEKSGMWGSRRQTHKHYTTAVDKFRAGQRVLVERDPPKPAAPAAGAAKAKRSEGIWSMFTDAHLFRAEVESDAAVLQHRAHKYLTVRTV